MTYDEAYARLEALTNSYNTMKEGLAKTLNEIQELLEETHAAQKSEPYIEAGIVGQFCHEVHQRIHSSFTDFTAKDIFIYDYSQDAREIIEPLLGTDNPTEKIAKLEELLTGYQYCILHAGGDSPEKYRIRIKSELHPLHKHFYIEKQESN